MCTRPGCCCSFFLISISTTIILQSCFYTPKRTIREKFVFSLYLCFLFVSFILMVINNQQKESFLFSSILHEVRFRPAPKLSFVVVDLVVERIYFLRDLIIVQISLQISCSKFIYLLYLLKLSWLCRRWAFLLLLLFDSNQNKKFSNPVSLIGRKYIVLKSRGLFVYRILFDVTSNPSMGFSNH